jgi:hypothetical protein
MQPPQIRHHFAGAKERGHQMAICTPAHKDRTATHVLCLDSKRIQEKPALIRSRPTATESQSSFSYIWLAISPRESLGLFFFCLSLTHSPAVTVNDSFHSIRSRRTYFSPCVESQLEHSLDILVVLWKSLPVRGFFSHALPLGSSTESSPFCLCAFTPPIPYGICSTQCFDQILVFYESMWNACPI